MTPSAKVSAWLETLQDDELEESHDQVKLMVSLKMSLRLFG